LTKGDLELAVATLSLLKLDKVQDFWGPPREPDQSKWWNPSEYRIGFGAEMGLLMDLSSKYDGKV